MEKSKAWANVTFNGDFYEIKTISKGMLGYGDPDVDPQYLPPNSTDEELGVAIKVALSKSKRLNIEDFQKIWKSGAIEETEKLREKNVMREYGYKNKKSLYKNSDTCVISAFDSYIEIQPTHQDSLNGWTVKKDMGLTPLQISHVATDAELGASLRHAFTLCTSAVR